MRLERNLDLPDSLINVLFVSVPPQLPNLASIFRQHAPPPRTPALPTTFPSGLQPIASSNDVNGPGRQIHRRVSRTDLDFEQALRAEGTVMLQEGLDVNSLGVDASPSPVNKKFNSPALSSSTPRRPQPSTPVVVPPTPSPTAGPSTSKLPAPSPSSSSHDLFYDAEDSERQTNRRSIYRSPGTSSSPDLATLLRKAKEKGGVVNVYQKKEKRRESPPPLPRNYDGPPNGTRPRASPSFSASPVSSASPQVTPLPKGKNKMRRGTLPESSPDWVLTSPRPPKENGKVRSQTFCNYLIC